MSNSYNYSNRKLTFEQAKNIRTEYATGTTSYAKLGKKYGLSDWGIIRIIKGKAYTHPTPTEAHNEKEGIPQTC